MNGTVKSAAVFVLLLLAFIPVSAFMPIDRSKGNWQLANVSGHLPDLKYELRADNGKVETEANERGHVTLLLFGYTGCPDECPATMMRLTHILKTMGKDAGDVRILFVTVDPQNDTPRVLHDYMKNFDPGHMKGLTGTSADIEALAKRYRAAYQPRNHSGKDEDIVHSNAIYIFDAEGHARSLATPSDKDENLVHDLRSLTAGS